MDDGREEWYGEYDTYFSWGGSGNVEPHVLKWKETLCFEARKKSEHNIKNYKWDPETKTLSWENEENYSKAEITFYDSPPEEFEHYWRDWPAQGRPVFCGWCQYPREGHIGFRGTMKPFTITKPARR